MYTPSASIVDEIYALSSLNPHSNSSNLQKEKEESTVDTFVSILSIDCYKDAGCDPRRVHARECNIDKSYRFHDGTSLECPS